MVRAQQGKEGSEGGAPARTLLYFDAAGPQPGCPPSP